MAVSPSKLSHVAKVDMKLFRENHLARALDSVASYEGDDPRAGLTRSETIQTVAHLAVWRDAIMAGGSPSVAYYDDAGKVQAVSTSETREKFRKRVDAGLRPLQLFGAVPYKAPFPAGDGLPKDWGRQLGMAIDWSFAKMTRAEQRDLPDEVHKAGFTRGDESDNYGRGIESDRDIVLAAPLLPAASPAVVLGVVAIGVVGTAAAVIGGIAVYRYLDPQVRVQQAAIAAAAESYQRRVDTFRETGSMPPASQMEKEAADVVKNAAAEQRRKSWGTTAMWVGGTVAATALVGLTLRYAGE